MPVVTLYLIPSCTSCRKARAWLKEYKIPFIERDMLKKPPKLDELKRILSLTYRGTEDIISTRTQAYKDLNIDVNELSLAELLEVIQEHPNILKKPIIIDDKRIQIGYNEDEIRKFVPREVRKFELERAKEMIATMNQ